MSTLRKMANSVNAALLAAVAVLFFLPQCRIDSQSYQSLLTGLNLTLGTRPYVHVEGMSDEEYQKLIDAAQGMAQAAGQNLPKPQDSTDPVFLGVLLLPALAAIAFAQAAFKPPINSFGASRQRSSCLCYRDSADLLCGVRRARFYRRAGDQETERGFEKFHGAGASSSGQAASRLCPFDRHPTSAEHIPRHGRHGTGIIGTSDRHGSQDSLV